MSMLDLRDAIAIIEAGREEADFEGPKPEELIARAEKALGLDFPQTYREFLKRLGCGDIAGAEFYGIIKDDFENSSVPDAIWLTLKHRTTSGLPPALVLVYSTGDGHYYAIDTSKKDWDGESPLVEWVPGASNAGERLQVVADNFGTFFRQKVGEALNSSFLENLTSTYESDCSIL